MEREGGRGRTGILSGSGALTMAARWLLSVLLGGGSERVQEPSDDRDEDGRVVLAVLSPTPLCARLASLGLLPAHL